MSIGKNIKRLRNQRGMTQKELGIALGLNANNADVRIAQYESGARTPKEKLIISIAQVFEVDTAVLTAPDMAAYIRVMHTLNELEILCGQALDIISALKSGANELNGASLKGSGCSE